MSSPLTVTMYSAGPLVGAEEVGWAWPLVDFANADLGFAFQESDSFFFAGRRDEDVLVGDRQSFRFQNRLGGIDPFGRIRVIEFQHGPCRRLELQLLDGKFDHVRIGRAPVFCQSSRAPSLPYGSAIFFQGPNITLLNACWK